MEILDYHGEALQRNDVCRLREDGGYVRVDITNEGKFYYVEIEDEASLYSLNSLNSANLELIYRH